MPQRPFSAAVRVNASFWLLVLLAAIVSPLTVVAAILTAAALHELGHLAVMRYYGVSVKRFRLTALGAELNAPTLARLPYGRELIVTLAGVTVNLFCAVLLALLGLRTKGHLLIEVNGVGLRHVDGIIHTLLHHRLHRAVATLQRSLCGFLLHSR